jgi:D-glycero-D-manno-heptose 1,7-bisphosphate phosphatase
MARDPLMSSKRYVLLDRDGTLIVERNYLSRVADLELLPGAVEGLRTLRDAGFGLVVLTNQSGLARGKLTPETLTAIHAELERRLEAHGVRIEAFYHCPHLPSDGCACRKPKPGLAERAAGDFGFELSQAFVVGDKASDVELGRNCGACTVLVRTGYGREWEAGGLQADYIADDVRDAAGWIVRTSARQRGR